MAESLNETIAQQRIRSYEISIWTLQDRFLSVLKWSTMDQKGQVQDPEVVLRDDGTEELSFVIPKFYYSGAERIQNPMWLHLQDQPLEANMHKLKVIFNKNYEDERVFEFLVTSVTSDHAQDRIDISVKAEGLAFHELGKVGYKIALSQENYELELEQWIKRGMHGEKPRMNIQYWNDLIFKDSNGDWRTNWQYEVRMDWSSYSRGNEEKDPSCVYEDEYVSSWQLDANEKLIPRYTEGFKEKWRPVEIKESNVYNATQTIAEQFGVFCRYEYEHDENYQITGKKVIYYNNYLYDKEGHIDLTYPYSSSGITRTIDNSSVTTKLFVTNVEQDSNTISIMDVDANKSREDYLLCLDYLKDVDGINEDQYEAVQEYEAKMYKYNTSLSKIQERIRILTNQIVKADADYTLYDNAYNLDKERYEEAKKGLSSITGGKRYIPVDTHFIVMEDNENGLGLYIRMRFEGMDETSIRLYAKSNFSSMNGSQYSDPVLFSPKKDEYGELIYLYNLQGNVTTGDSVYLSGMRDPQSYYEKLMEIWDKRRVLDEEKRKKAEDDSIRYNWYLHGSRAGYGLVGSAEVNQAYYGIMTTAPFDGSEEELYAFDMAHPYVSWYVGQGRVGLEGEIYDYNDEYDHFEQIDKDAETADLYYFQEYFLKQKELEYNKLERMLGPALREGYWTPEDYHDYGDQYEASFVLNAGASKIKDEDISQLNNFIEGSMVQAFSPDSTLAPHLQVLWDCNKYYDNEEPLVYTSSISDNRDQHLTINLTDYMDIVRQHLDDLCLFYCSTPVIKTIDDISGKVSGSTLSKKAIVEYNLNKFTEGQYYKGGTGVVGTKYYSKLYYFINTKLETTEPDTAAHSPFNKYFATIDTLKETVKTLRDSNPSYTDVSTEKEETVLTSLENIAEVLYNLQGNYEKIIEEQNSIKNANEETSTKYKNAEAAIKFGKDQKAWIDAAYAYLMDADTTFISEKMGEIETGANEYYSTLDKGLLIFIKQYKTYVNWLESLEETKYYSFQVNSQAELGWVLDTQYEKNNDRYSYNRFPALIVTGAKTLDEETLRLMVKNKFIMDDEQEPRTVADSADSEEKYKPFLGYYEIEENEKTKTKAFTIKTLSYLKESDFIGVDCTERYTRVLKSSAKNDNGNARQPYADEYRYRRVYPRLFFKTIKLKNTSSDLYVNVNGRTLDSLKDYSVVTDDRSVGQRTQGIGYYLTLKPSILFQYGKNDTQIDVSYTLSNSDVAIYLDAIKVMRENAYPKVSYDVELSVLNPEFVRTAYNRLNQIVHINDNDLQLEEVSGYISTVNLKLEKPWEDTVEIKNYETKFEDLFTTIVAQTEAMKKSSQGLDTALQAFSRTTGLIDSDVLYNSMLNTDLNLSFNQGKLTIDQNEGIWGTSDNGVVAFRGGGIFTSNEYDANGNRIWNTGILPSGINASLITTGQLDTNKIKVFAGDQLRFQLNGEGLYAYKPFAVESKDITQNSDYAASNSNIDSHQYVVFNSEGLFLTAEAGAIYANIAQIDNKTGVIKYGYDTLSKDVDRVEVSWKGLILRNWKGEDVFYANPNTGDLTLKGEIQATSGKIAGWEITENSLKNKGLALKSGPADEDIGIELYSGGISYDVVIDSDGTAYYPYNPINVNNSTIDEGTVYYLKFSSRGDVTIDSNTNYYTSAIKNASAIPRYQKREVISTTDNPDYAGTSESNNELILNANITTSVEVQIYIMLDSDLTIYATDNNNKYIVYDGNSSLDSSWYTKLQSKYPATISEYVIYSTEAYFEEHSGENMTLRPQGWDKATFFAYADTGDVKILQGTIGDFKIHPNTLSDGTIQSAILSGTNNKIVIGNYTTSLGQLFSDFTTDPNSGVITFKRANGDVKNFNIAEMQAYKTAVSAAAKLTLTLNVAGKKYTFTAP